MQKLSKLSENWSKSKENLEGFKGIKETKLQRSHENAQIGTKLDITEDDCRLDEGIGCLDVDIDNQHTVKAQIFRMARHVRRRWNS